MNDHPALKFVKAFAFDLCEHIDKLDVTQRVGADMTLITIKCCYQDRGKLLGKGGEVMYALKTIVSMAGVRQGQPAELELNAPAHGKRGDQNKIAHTESYDPEPAMELLDDALTAMNLRAHLTTVRGDDWIYFETLPIQDSIPSTIEHALNTLIHIYGIATGHQRLAVRVSHTKVKV